MLSAVSFAPDGCALDAEDHVWAANALGAAVCRVAPGGQIVDEVAMPGGLGVFACGLGGEDGRTLIACAAPDFDEQARAAAREAVLRRQSKSRTPGCPESEPAERTGRRLGAAVWPCSIDRVH
jgi:hypothetical protein